MNRAGVPYGGIVITAVVAVFGVVLNAVRLRHCKLDGAW